jgi:hypothetical protein
MVMLAPLSSSIRLSAKHFSTFCLLKSSKKRYGLKKQSTFGCFQTPYAICDTDVQASNMTYKPSIKTKGLYEKQ